ncbi:hypothetical protein BH24CHL9_BH24CHL9_00780 [soil metagenome]
MKMRSELFAGLGSRATALTSATSSNEAAQGWHRAGGDDRALGLLERLADDRRPEVVLLRCEIELWGPCPWP